jgi:hypothetical protein
MPTSSKTYVQGVQSKFEQLRLNITFFVIARFNIKITAIAIPVINIQIYRCTYHTA